MTTIAYRAGIMVADTRGYSGDKVPLGRKVKIRKLADGTLVGASSCKPGQTEAAMDWYAAGADPKAGPGTPDLTLLAVRPDGRAFFLAADQWLLSGPVEAEFFAIGSGEQYAMGALAMGANAETALAVACKLDVWSAEPITVLSH